MRRAAFAVAAWLLLAGGHAWAQGGTLGGVGGLGGGTPAGADPAAMLFNRPLNLGTGALTAGSAQVNGALGVTGAATLTGGGSVGALLTFDQPASIQFNGTRTWSGSQTAVGNAEIYSFTNQSGTSTGSPVAYHFFSVATDTVQDTHGASLVEADLTTGAGITGVRNGFLDTLSINGTPGDAGQYTSGAFHFQASAAANASGNIGYGTNPTCGLNSAATGSWSCVGEEIDIAAHTGSTPLMNTGLTIVTVTGHTAHGANNLDSSISIGNQSGTTTGWDYGVRFGGPGNAFPFVPTATLIYTYPAASGLAIANGIDIHNNTFTGNTWNDGHIVLTGAGDALMNSATPLATTATAGFLHLPNTTAAPTGTPTNTTPGCEWNTGTHTLNCYDGTSWYHFAGTAGAG